MRLNALAILLALAVPAHAVDIVTATVTVTNAPTGGETFTANSSVRTWATGVSNVAAQIQVTNSVLTSSTNLFNHLARTPVSASLNLAWSSTNAIRLQSAPGGALAITLSAGWGTVSLATNQLTNATILRLPITVETPANQTNLADGLTYALSLSTGTITSRFVGPLTGTFAGNSSNLVNYGLAVSSRGPITGAEQFGASASATGSLSTAVGAASTAYGAQSVSFGYLANATGTNSTAIGTASYANADNATALGTYAGAVGADSTAIGTYSSADFEYSVAVGRSATVAGQRGVALGYGATAVGSNSMTLGTLSICYNDDSVVIGPGARSTDNNQIVLGGSNHTVKITGILSAAKADNMRVTGTMFASNTSPGKLLLPRMANTGLATGNNAAVDVGTNTFVEVSGPGGAFSINGIAGGIDGRMVILLNQTGNRMTIANDSGVDPAAGNRIYTMTGSDRSTTNNGSAMLLYSGAASRWMLISIDGEH